jgi:hypothetical protein
LTGLIPQYRAAASLILGALRRRELDFIELTHDENGAVDDIVIGTPLRVDAYQVLMQTAVSSISSRTTSAAPSIF